MIRRPPRSTLTDTLLPYTTLFRSLIVSGFRSPTLPMADTPLYRLPSLQLRAELRARFGAVADAASTPWEGGLAEQALRADLQACDTYRHRHLEPLSTLGRAAGRERVCHYV